MKNLARRFVVSILGWQVRRLRAKRSFKIVGVVGSIGKTSTKFAIATVLGQAQRVRFQAGNYNDPVSVPLVFFGLNMPSLLNPLAWLWVFLRIELQLLGRYPFDVVVVELGTDGPGQITQFKKYLKLDMAVVTAITPEHMEFFQTMSAVAEEEFAVADFSKQVIVNQDLCDKKYLPKNLKAIFYGESAGNYRLRRPQFAVASARFDIEKSGKPWISAVMEAVAKSELYSAAAASAVADLLGLNKQTITDGIAKIQPVSGRMQRLKGIKDSLIIDESYNASPTAVMSALDSLYQMKAPQKIALLGNMNELGDMSQQAHKNIGDYCEPKQLDLVVTLGPDANKFTAAAAQAKGCQVIKAENPHDAGEVIKRHLKTGAVVLIKGSQNNVYAEEAIKPLLADPEDVKLLVRQSPDWLAKKKQNFSR